MAISRKAKTVAHSTSMGETNCGLAVVSGAQMVAVGLTEIRVALKCTSKQMISVLIEMSSTGQYVLCTTY
eukprot:4115327-Pyramimonas_sp.AAC.2